MDEIQKMREKMKALAAKAKNLNNENPGEKFTAEIETEFNEYMKEIEVLNKAIERQLTLNGLEDTAGSTPIFVPALATQVAHNPVYNDIGQQLIDVMDMTVKNEKAPFAAERFEKMINAVNAKRSPENSMITGIDAEGGYLVETDKSKEILTTDVETDVLTRRCQTQPIGPNSDSFEYYKADDRDRSAGTFLGGVKAYRKSEIQTMDQYSKALIEPSEVKLADMYALLKVSNRMIRDNVALTGMVRNSIPKAFGFKSDQEIWEGNGAGQHLGVMNSDLLITVARETNQLKTIVAPNLYKMLIRFKGNIRTAAWFVNQDTLAQFPMMTIGNYPVYLPGGSMANSPYGIALGIPIVPIEFCSTLGTVGDIMLGDFSQYLRIAKGGTEEAESIHVAFLTDQKVFRFIQRNNGHPIYDTPITPLKGTNTLSPFIVLETRPAS